LSLEFGVWGMGTLWLELMAFAVTKTYSSLIELHALRWFGIVAFEVYIFDCSRYIWVERHHLYELDK